MTRQELVEAMDLGLTVHWANRGYVCYKDKFGEYVVTFTPNRYTIGIFHLDGVGMNLKPEECFLGELLS